MCLKKSCTYQHEKWKATLDFRIKKGEEELEKINVDKLDYFRSDYEILRKELVSDWEIRETLRHGWVIDAQPHMILVLAYVKVGGKFTPIHVKLTKTEYEDKDFWFIQHAYYPTVEKWGKSFDEKICFCKENAKEVMVG